MMSWAVLQRLPWHWLGIGAAFLAMLVTSALWISSLKVRIALEESARVRAETEASRARSRAQEFEHAYGQLARAVQEQAEAIARWEQAARRAKEEAARARDRAISVADLQGREIARLRAALAAPGVELKHCEDAAAEIRAALARERAQ